MVTCCCGNCAPFNAKIFLLFHHVEKEFWKPDQSCYKCHAMTQKLVKLFQNQSDFSVIGR